MSTASIDIFPLIKDTVDSAFEQCFDDREQKSKVVEALMQWLTLRARKKTVPDLTERLRGMRERTQKMVDNMTVVIEKDKPVVKVRSSDEETWKMFRLGTDWFEPNPDAIETVLSGLFNK